MWFDPLAFNICYTRFYNEDNEECKVGGYPDIIGGVGASAAIGVKYTVLAVRGRRRQKVPGQLQHGRFTSGKLFPRNHYFVIIRSNHFSSFLIASCDLSVLRPTPNHD